MNVYGVCKKHKRMEVCPDHFIDIESLSAMAQCAREEKISLFERQCDKCYEEVGGKQFVSDIISGHIPVKPMVLKEDKRRKR